MQENIIDETVKISQNQESPRAVVEDLNDDGNINNNTKIESSSMLGRQKKKFIIFVLVAIVAGILTGYGSTYLKNEDLATSEKATEIVSDTSQIKTGDIFGVQDKSTFTDNAQGYLEKGGIEGEGSHRLLREGGITQTVTLTSSVADLDDFIGMEIKIWGETNKAQASGWFMDVGRVEVIDIDAQSPIQTLD